MKHTAKSNFLKRLSAGIVTLLLSITPLATTALFVSGLTVGGISFANPADQTVADSDGTTTFTNVQVAVCNVAKALQGPVGIGIGFLVLVGGIIMVQVASRDALPMIARAAFGTALLLGASAAFAAVVVAPCAA